MNAYSYLNKFSDDFLFYHKMTKLKKISTGIVSGTKFLHFTKQLALDYIKSSGV